MIINGRHVRLTSRQSEAPMIIHKVVVGLRLDVIFQMWYICGT
jgi:hypothetical protein